MVGASGRMLLALLAALQLAHLPATVSPCGHHVVVKDIKSLVRMHLSHQSAHPLSGVWGPVALKAARAAAVFDKSGESGGSEGEGNDDLVAGNAGVAPRKPLLPSIDVRPDEHGSFGDHDAGKHHQHGDTTDEEQGHSVEHDHNFGHGHGRGHDLKCLRAGHAPGADRLEGTEGADSLAEEDVGVWAADQGQLQSMGGEQPEERVATAAAQRLRRLRQATSAPSPAPLRLAVTYQQLGSLDASQQQMLTRVVQAVGRILRKFVSLKRPPTGGLLADPYCLETNGWRCTLYYPDFTGSPRSSRMCGNATLLPQHVVRPSNCTQRASLADVLSLADGTAGPASGAGSGASAYGSGCSSYAGTQGEATDMYLYITAVQNEDCVAGAAAWARPCLLDMGDSRPLLGTANICPGALRLLDENSLTAVLTHEMIHALGFTDSMFNLTRRPDGSPRPFSEVVSTTKLPGGVQISRLITPGVRDAARSHFNCSSLTGAQLEEEGSDGSAGSHWEYTHYQGEVMVASTIFAADGSPPAVSNLTLSYLEDTGWYVANRSTAGLLRWAAGTGCALPNSTSCQQFVAAVPGQNLFCDPSAATSSDGSPSFRCSNDYKATGVCRSLNFTGGCGLLLSNNAEQTCIGPDAAGDMPDVFGWGTGSPSGRCFPVVYRFQAQAGNGRYTYPGNGRDGDVDAACFDTACSADGSKVYVKMLGKQFECPAGQYLSLPELLPGRYLAGRIGPCPSARALCSTQSCPASSCNPAGGDCLDGSCYCHLEFTGAGCSLNLITGQALADGSGTSNNSTNGSSSGVTASPPPPKAVWTQVVQLTLSLYNPRADVASRSASYASVLAMWSELDASDVRIASIALPLGDSGNASVSITSGQQAGDAYVGTASGSRRRSRQRRQVLQTAAMPPPQAVASSSAPPPPAAGSVVTALLTAGGSRATTILLARLQDSTQRSLLQSGLASAGFFLVPNSLVVQTLITLVTDLQSTSNTSSTALAAQDSAASGKMVIIVAIAAGAAAVVGIVAAVVAVYVVRARRNKEQKAANEAAQRAGRFATYQNQATFPSSAGGVAVGADGGGTLPYTAGAPAAAQAYPVAAGAAVWTEGPPVYGGGAARASPPQASEAVAQSYYSARAGALAAQSETIPYPPPSGAATGFPSPLYSGPQYGAYR